MTPTINRMLLAINLSRNSTKSMAYAVALAKATGAEIRVVNVLEALSEDARMTLMMFMQDAKSRADALGRRSELAAEALRDWHEAFWETQSEEDKALRDRVVSVDVIEGFPAEAILRTAKEHQCDLIVMGAHEHGFTHTFLGTVATKVLRRAAIPTLIVPYSDD